MNLRKIRCREGFRYAGECTAQADLDRGKEVPSQADLESFSLVLSAGCRRNGLTVEEAATAWLEGYNHRLENPKIPGMKEEATR